MGLLEESCKSYDSEMFCRRQLVIQLGVLASCLTATAALAQTKKLSSQKVMAGTEITSVVNSIVILSDLRDWASVRRCFADQVDVDYTSLTGGKPKTIAAEALVQRWKTAFESTFKTTQHLLGTHVITLQGDTATCLSHFQARHTTLDTTKGIWTLGGHYHDDLVCLSSKD